MLIGFEFIRVDGEEIKTFVPLDKILYVEELYERDLITGKRTGEPRPGARIHLVTKESMLVEQDYSDILDKWLKGTGDSELKSVFHDQYDKTHPGTFDLSN